MVGRRFGRLLVEMQGPHSPAGKVRWWCICRCGKRVVVDTNSLNSGNSTSCGCLRRDTLGKHFMTRKPEYIAWRGMKRRCNNDGEPGYELYGGRGIKVCDEWQHDFAAFYAHIGPRPSDAHSVDRIDVNKGYEPGNVRWATKSEQANNRRDNRHVVFGGEKMTVAEIARAMGIDWKTAKRRYANV